MTTTKRQAGAPAGQAVRGNGRKARTERGNGSEAQKAQTGGLELLKTGVPNLDGILGGGIPLYSVNLVTGAPGCGKTILMQQMAFSLAGPQRKCIYFATLSEPSFKLIRYQQQFNYFDTSKLGEDIHFIDIGSVIREQGVDEALVTINDHVQKHDAAVVIIDSFKALHDLTTSKIEARQFGYDLTVQLATWGCTSFLVGEYTEHEIQNEPVFAIADGIIHMENSKQAMQNFRTLNVTKMRGRKVFTGDHPFGISDDGITVFPRVTTPASPAPVEIGDVRLSSGIPGLDEMLEGGYPRSSVTLVVGGAGSGKTLTGLEFIVQGVEAGEPGLMVTFQETPGHLASVARGFGWDLEAMQASGLLRLLYSSPVELSVDEHTAMIKDAIQEMGAKRVVIDSLMDIEIATPDKVRYKDYIYSLVSYFRSQGITSLLTNEIPKLFGSLQLSSAGISFISDTVILLRYVEMESALTRAISVLKMRGSDHDKSLREFRITSQGIEVLERFEHTSGMLGSPSR